MRNMIQKTFQTNQAHRHYTLLSSNHLKKVVQRVLGPFWVAVLMESAKSVNSKILRKHMAGSCDRARIADAIIIGETVCSTATSSSKLVNQRSVMGPRESTRLVCTPYHAGAANSYRQFHDEAR